MDACEINEQRIVNESNNNMVIPESIRVWV